MKENYTCELDFKENTVRFFIPTSKDVSINALVKRVISFLTRARWEYVKTNKLSIDQMRLIWVLCREYGELIGYTKDEMRDFMRELFCSTREIEYFSISPSKREAASMELATEFTQFIIEHAVTQGYNLILHEGRGDKKRVRSAREVVPDVRRWVLAHLLNKSCAVCCRKGADLHHYIGVNEAGGYANDTGLETPFLSLCRTHHTEIHAIGKEKFSSRYHLEGIWLSENIVENLLKVYPGHFKGYRKMNM